MFPDNCEQELKLNTFLQENIAILTLIGVFSAIFIYFFDKSSNDEILLLTLYSIILVIFLMIYLIFSGAIAIIVDAKCHYQKGTTAYLSRFSTYFSILAVIIIFSFIVFSLFCYAINKFQNEFNLSLVMIEIGIFICFSALCGVFILKERNFDRLALGFIILSGLYVVSIGGFMEIFPSPPITYHVIGPGFLLLILIFLVFIKIAYITIQGGFTQFKEKLSDIKKRYHRK